MNSIFYEGSKTPKFIESEDDTPSISKNVFQLTNTNAQIYQNYLRDGNSIPKKLIIPTKNMENIRMLVQNQIVNNMKLLSKIEEIYK